MDPTTAIVSGLAIFLGMMVVLIPITGLTARFALKPLMEALSKYRELQGGREATDLLERRVALMEEQFHSLERSVREIHDGMDFQRQLGTGAERASLPAPGDPLR